MSRPPLKRKGKAGRIYTHQQMKRACDRASIGAYARGWNDGMRTMRRMFTTLMKVQSTESES